MAHDYDDNVLLDSDEEGGKAKKTKDFIPKPRLLTAPANKLAAIAGHTSSSHVEETRRSKADSVSSNAAISPGNSHKDLKFIDSPSMDPGVRISQATTSAVTGTGHGTGIHPVLHPKRENVGVRPGVANYTPILFLTDFLSRYITSLFGISTFCYFLRKKIVQYLDWLSFLSGLAIY